jgi:ABC-type arginine/histidine transport system permease subunit
VDNRAGLAEGYSLGFGLFVLSDPSITLRRPKLEASQIGILSPACRVWGVHPVRDYWKVNVFMRRPSDFFNGISSRISTGLKSGVWQAILHLAVVYAVARLCTPWLITVTHDAIIPLVTGRPPRINLQFFYSHLFAFSSVPGLIAGFLNAKLFHHMVVRFVWIAPVIVLVIAFVFYAPENFREAFHYYFGGQFNIPEYSTYTELQRKMFVNLPEVTRGTTQLRISVPAYAGVAYSLGALFSSYWNRKSVEPSEVVTATNQ